MAKTAKPILAIEIVCQAQLEHCAEEVKSLLTKMAAFKPESK